MRQNPYDYVDYTEVSALQDGDESLVYDIRNRDIGGASSSSSRQVSYPMLHFNYSQKPPNYYYPPSVSLIEHPFFFQRVFFERIQVEHDATVYISPDQAYYHEPTTSGSAPSSSSSTSFSPRESTPFQVNQLSYTESSPHVTSTHLQKTFGDDASPPPPPPPPPESPNLQFRQLNRQMKPPTLKFNNDCQLAVMRVDQLSSSPEEDSHLEPLYTSSSHHHSHHSHHQSLHVSSNPRTTAPTEFLLSSPTSPSIGLSSLPPTCTPERKPPLACLFCRGRKIACGPPLPGKKTCK